MAHEPIEIQLNGDPRQVADGLPLTALLDELGLKAGVLVEYNERPLLPREWADIRLGAGDRVELIRIVAGG